MNVEGCPSWPKEREEAYRASGYWQGTVLGRVLEELTSQHPERCALVDEHRRLNYQELLTQSRKLARGLRSQGLKRGDIVLLQVPNRVELFEALFALAMLGVPPVLALPSHREFELGSFAGTTRAKAILTLCDERSFDYVSLAQRVARQAEHPVSVLNISHRPTQFREGCATVERLAGDHSPSIAPAPQASDVLLFQLSGGTTGTPKLIPRTHDDYLCSVRAANDACEWHTPVHYLAALPAQHNFPLSSPGVLGSLLCGGKAVLAQTPSPGECFEWIEREEVQWTAVVPSVLQVWIVAGAQRPPLETLQYVQVGGAPLASSLAEQVPDALGCSLQQVFGMAEGLVCYTRPGDPRHLVENCQGRPASAADEVRIVDDLGQPVAPGEEGELQTRGPYTICGYFRDEAEHSQRFTADGYYKTGDRVRSTPEGSLRVVGRSKEQINRGGDKIAPAEVEAHLLAHPAVAEAAVVPVPDPLLGERSCAFVASPAQAPSPAQLRAFLRARGVAAYKIPDRFEFRSELPKTGVRKVDKQRLKGIRP